MAAAAPTAGQVLMEPNLHAFKQREGVNMLGNSILPSIMRSSLIGLQLANIASRNSVAASLSFGPSLNSARLSSASWMLSKSLIGSTSRSFSTSSSGIRFQSVGISQHSASNGVPRLSLLSRALLAAESGLKIEPVAVPALAVRRLSFAASVPVGGSSSPSRDSPNDDKGDAGADGEVPRSVGYWLLAIGGMVYCMVSLGGITRLTESGLSMVDWKLLGRKLPSSDEEWNAEFDKYKQFPEYQLKHYNISLQEYKFIYFMEWFHRMWGRAIGVAFAVPFLVFGARGMLSRSMFKKLAIAMGMGGCQGLVGWYMVKSGLEKPKEEGHDVHVSPYRLCMHLTSAFVIYSYVMWLAMSVLRPRPSALASPAVKGIKKLAHASAGVLGVTIVSGMMLHLPHISLPCRVAPPCLSLPLLLRVSHSLCRCLRRRKPRWRVLSRVASHG